MAHRKNASFLFFLLFFFFRFFGNSRTARCQNNFHARWVAISRRNVHAWYRYNSAYTSLMRCKFISKFQHNRAHGAQQFVRRPFIMHGYGLTVFKLAVINFIGGSRPETSAINLSGSDFSTPAAPRRSPLSRDVPPNLSRSWVISDYETQFTAMNKLWSPIGNWSRCGMGNRCVDRLRTCPQLYADEKVSGASRGKLRNLNKEYSIWMIFDLMTINE